MIYKLHGTLYLKPIRITDLVTTPAEKIGHGEGDNIDIISCPSG